MGNIIINNDEIELCNKLIGGQGTENDGDSRLDNVIGKDLSGKVTFQLIPECC